MTQLKIIPVTEIAAAREAYFKMSNEKQIADFLDRCAECIQRRLIEKEDNSFQICTDGHWSEILGGGISESAAKTALVEIRAAGYKTYEQDEYTLLPSGLHITAKRFVVAIRPLKEFSKRGLFTKVILKEIK